MRGRVELQKFRQPDYDILTDNTDKTCNYGHPISRRGEEWI